MSIDDDFFKKHIREFYVRSGLFPIYYPKPQRARCSLSFPSSCQFEVVVKIISHIKTEDDF